MTGKLGSTNNKYFKGSSDLNKKQVYIQYNIQLFSILNNTVTVTDENSLLNFGKSYSRTIGEELLKTIKTYTIGSNPEMIRELIRIGSIVTDFIQLTKKLFLFYIIKFHNSSKILNKPNLSYFETVDGNKIHFYKEE